MPKLVAHTAILDRFIDKLLNSADDNEKRLGELLASNREYAVLGGLLKPFL